ncbi:hypothetical protein LEMLEM_LOCUS4406 [Lemmus lemmus]
MGSSAPALQMTVPLVMTSPVESLVGIGSRWMLASNKGTIRLDPRSICEIPTLRRSHCCRHTTTGASSVCSFHGNCGMVPPLVQEISPGSSSKVTSIPFRILVTLRGYSEAALLRRRCRSAVRSATSWCSEGGHL